MADNSPTEVLNSITLETQSLRTARDALSRKAEGKDADILAKSTAFDTELKKLRTGVASNRLSLGDPVSDYVLVNYPFYEHDRFSEKFEEGFKSLSSLLGKLSKARCFWHHKLESAFLVESKDVYEVLFLGEKPYIISPKNITLQANSSRIITLETVFLDKEARWPFVKNVSEGKELVIAPGEASGVYTTPRLTDGHCDINYLEKILMSNPLALVVFRKAFGLEVTSELQEIADQYVHGVALKAFKAIRENYHSVKSSDRKIMEIDKKYNSPQKVTEMFATGPVIPDHEPDPFLAAIMSSDARDERVASLKRLVSCITDLDRTGLVNYNIPLEERIGPGKMMVSNLAEFSKYVRNILELGYKPQEKLAVR